MILEIRHAPPFYKNGFVLGCEATRKAVIIDPGDEVEQLLEAVRQHGLEVGQILLTHAHVDHLSGVAAAKAALKAPIYLHEADLPLYQAAAEQARFFGFSIQQPPPVDAFFEIPGGIEFGRCRLEVLHTPGHTPGGVSLVASEAGKPLRMAFVGDTLFAGSIGRTDLPGGDYDTILGSIRGVLFKLGDDVEVYAGHGPRTMIGQERSTNPFLTGGRR